MMGTNPHTEHGWTIATYAAHNEALRLADDKLRAADERFYGERDRRYAEVKNAEEKALRVKDEADKNALTLAREIQTYKDEKANELRSQIERERGDYATQADLKSLSEKVEAALMPIRDHMAAQTASSKGMRDVWGWVAAVVMAAIALFGRHLTF